MPPSKSPAYTYAQLVTLLGKPAHERSRFEPPPGTPAVSREKVNLGWLWRCGCAAFARPNETDAYMLIACAEHQRII